MDKLELPLLHSMTTGSVATSLDTLPDSTTRPASSDLPTMPPSPEEEEEEEDVEQEVVDVESYQPCVVDLTNEDEDDVDVVEVVPREQSIIYLGTENRRSTLRRRNTGSTAPPPALEDLTRPDQQQHSIFESGGGGGDDGGGTGGEEGIMFGGERQQNHWLMDAQSIDFQNPNLVFGNLLGDYPVEGGESQIPRRLNPLREFRANLRRHRSRSRSPQIPDYTREATRTPEIVQDVHEMQSEVESRRPPSHHNLAQVPIVQNAVQIVAQEHNQKVAQITAPQPPPSPPPREQPIISCMVCLDSAGTIKESSRTLCSTVCGHIFCSICLEECVKRKKQCPICRKKLTKKQYHPLFI